jgi:hypothetical protein
MDLKRLLAALTALGFAFSVWAQAPVKPSSPSGAAVAPDKPVKKAKPKGKAKAKAKTKARKKAGDK